MIRFKQISFLAIILSLFIYIGYSIIINYLANFYYENGEKYKKEERYDEAIDEYKKAISFDKERAEPYISLAALYTKLSIINKGEKRFLLEKAREYYLNAAEINPYNSFVHRDLGWVYYQLAQTERLNISKARYLSLAKKGFTQAVNLYPVNPHLHLSLGRFYFNIGKSDDAIFEYKKASLYNPLKREDILREADRIRKKVTLQ
ncbi:MAG: tetratricopeptide repeat protein [Nitrospirota bacterium]